MFQSILEKLSARKRQIFWVIVIVSAFYLISVWSVGSIISFTAFYCYGFSLLTRTLGINEWLARAILIPMAALLAYSLSKMLSLTSKKARQEGTVLAVAILTLFSFAAYVHTKDIVVSTSLFDNGGRPAYRYYLSNGRMDLFPINTTRHPALGTELTELSSQVMEKFKSQGREQAEKQFLAMNDTWTFTGYYVLRGDEIEINEHGRVPGIDLLIRIGEKGPTKYIEVSSSAGYKRKITADSDGLLYLMIGEQLYRKASVEVVIIGLSIRLYQ